MKYTRLDTHPIFIKAVEHINSDSRRKYHNMSHVEAMYNFLEDNEFEYDEALDWAVILHDVVYDEKPNKELRSAGWVKYLEEYYPKELLNRIGNSIIATETHDYRQGEDLWPIIYADLHGFLTEHTAEENYQLVKEEYMLLYGQIDDETFIKNNAIFLIMLSQRCPAYFQKPIFELAVKKLNDLVS